MTTTRFDGAKVALFLGSRLLIIRRDDDPAIPWPDHWDFPGGGRERDETPFETAARETFEEVGLSLLSAHVQWRTCDSTAHGTVWFFVAQLPAGAQADIVFGDEGRFWRLAEVDDVLSLPDVAGNLQARLARWRAGKPDTAP